MANLQFVDPDGALLDQRATLAGFTYGFSQNEWSDELLLQPLGEVTMRYRGNPGRRSQAFAFSKDIDNGYDEMRGLYQLAAGTGFAAPYEAQLDCKPRLAPRLLWTGTENPLDPLETSLYGSSFYGDVLYGVDIEPCPLDLAPVLRAGSVKSAVVYDQGLCSFVVDLTVPVRDLVRRSSTELVSGMLSAPFYNDVLVSIERKGVEARTYVRHDSGAGSTAVGGGMFFAAAWNFVTIPTWNDLEVRMAYDFEFLLYESQIIVIPHQVLREIDGGGIFGDPISNSIAQGVAAGIIDDNIEDELARLNDQSRVEPFPAFECNPNLAHVVKAACQQQMLLAEAGVVQGANNLDASQAVPFSQQDVQDMRTAITEPQHWACELRNVTPGGPGMLDPHYGCFFRPPVKRMNVYPHQVEAVLFDERDVHNASYAAWVAANASADPEARQEAIDNVCRRGETAVQPAIDFSFPDDDDGDVALYGYRKLPPDNHAEWNICDECLAWGCLGCEDAPCVCPLP